MTLLRMQDLGPTWWTRRRRGWPTRQGSWLKPQRWLNRWSGQLTWRSREEWIKRDCVRSHTPDERRTHKPWRRLDETLGRSATRSSRTFLSGLLVLLLAWT